MKDLIVVPKPHATRIWVAWEDGSWSELDVAGQLLNAYPPLEDAKELVDWAVSVAKFGGPAGQKPSE